MNTHVIKIGGENASDPRTAEWLARENQDGSKIAVAISALRTRWQLKTTDELMRAQQVYNISGMNESSKILENLFQIHIQTLKEAKMYDPDLEEKLRFLFSSYFPYDLAFSPDILEQALTSVQEQRFIGYGEVMSAHILSHLLDTRFQIANTLIDHRILKTNTSLSETLKKEIGMRVDQWINTGIMIVPGYVSVANQSILSAYGRWYTDKMAERVAVWLAELWHNSILHIQKQDALRSSNPTNRNNTQILENLSYYSAAEITGARGANAQVLNENTITRDLVENNIPVWVYNPFEKDAPKSVISKKWSEKSGIQFIDGRDHVSTIAISGFSMSWPWLLARVSDVLAKENISIDSIVSSETEFTLTTYHHLDEATKKTLENKLQGEIGEDYSVSIKNNLWLIYCIGDNLTGHPGQMEKISTALADANIDIECLSQSRGQRAVTIGVSSENLQNAIDVLHETLIENKN